MEREYKRCNFSTRLTMPNYFDKHTATGASRIQKVNLSIQGEVDMEEIRKTDKDKHIVRIDKNTIKLVKNGK